MTHGLPGSAQMLRTEESVFCTAIDLFGIRVGAVHTKLD